MSATTLLPGVDLHHDAYRVRVRFGGRRHVETGFADADAANARALELRRLRDAGLTPEQAADDDPTLAEAVGQLLHRKRTTVSRKTRRPLRATGIEWWERSTRVWIEGEFAATPLSLLRRKRIEDYLLGRAAAHPKTAQDELTCLRAVLRYAEGRGASVDSRIYGIERFAVERRVRHALSVAELELLADHAPAYARALLLFAGTTGCRITELFTLSDDRCDLADRSVFIPADLCKEAADKWIDLMGEEVSLLRAQLMARAPGTPLVFPTRQGRPWTHSQFLKLVWYKTLHRAAVAWRAASGLPAAAPTPLDGKVATETVEAYRAAHRLPVAARTPFCGLEPHDLRATAATLMREAGFPREVAAARLGHADSGQLLDRVYDVGDRRGRARQAIAQLAPDGLRASLAGGLPGESATSRPAAAATITGPAGSQAGPSAAPILSQNHA